MSNNDREKKLEVIKNYAETANLSWYELKDDRIIIIIEGNIVYLTETVDNIIEHIKSTLIFYKKIGSMQDTEQHILDSIMNNKW